MTLQIIIVFSILALAVLLFVTEWVAMDVVALSVLLILGVSGLVTPGEVFAGFSNGAVVTVWAMFIISGGLSLTGVADVISRQVLRLGGEGSEARLIAVIMLTAGLMSAVMNNVAVAALMLPAVMDIARRTHRPPSKLLMPLSFGSLLGGLTTLIGTPPNILVSDALREQGLAPFRLLDFTPVGAVVLVGGVAFVALVGRRLLPDRDLARESTRQGAAELTQVYDLPGRMFVVSLPSESVLIGKTLEESRLGAAAQVNVIAVIRNGRTRLAPDPATPLQAGDRLLVKGDPDTLALLCSQRLLALSDEDAQRGGLTLPEMEIAEAGLASRCSLAGQTLEEAGFRNRYRLNVLAIRREGTLLQSNVRDIAIERGDTLLVQGPHVQIEALRNNPDFLVSSPEQAEIYQLHEQLVAVRVPADSVLVGKSLAESRLGDAFGLMVVGIVRDGATRLAPDPSERLEPGDTLLIEGSPDDMLAFRGLERLEIERNVAADVGMSDIESQDVGLIEAMLSPRTTLAGKTPRQIHFREKYGLTVLALWREGRALHQNLRDTALRLGDALLLYGPRQKMNLLRDDPDFLVLTAAPKAAPRPEKAIVSGLVLAGVLVPVLFGWWHISVAAVAGATLMVITGCLSIESAYRAIEWRAVFLIAGMLPLGTAMEKTGAARLAAEAVLGTIGGLGPLAVVAGLFILTSVATQFIPTPALVVLMAPIALSTAANLSLSPHALMMAIALSASASFMSPITHPANVMIMGPGGYRFRDYTRLGLPLTLLVLALVLLVLPIFWPLSA